MHESQKERDSSAGRIYLARTPELEATPRLVE